MNDMTDKTEMAKAVLEAVKGGDEAALAEALESFVYECTDGEGDEDGELRAKPILGLMVRRTRE